ncbi:MAG: (deoxy)nucleoside triphosphate pyrophosphohydrolase [Erysipelotrichaceae bacterium]|nr:(deoxy)nucleoside triphosphate pyrophosphohydrolase [Erysipelotrichaceae bacterium]
MKRLHVAAAVIMDGDKVFAAQRVNGAFAGGWEFPGGKCEAGETPAQTLVRELQEEMSLDIAVTGEAVRVECPYPDFRLVMDCCPARIVSGVPVLREHSAFRWVSWQDADHVDWLPADRMAVQILKDRFIGRHENAETELHEDEEHTYPQG